MSSALIAMGRSLEGFDVRAQTNIALTTMRSRRSPGHSKYSDARSSDFVPHNYERTTVVDGGDAMSDQMPILPEEQDRDGGIMVSRTIEHRSEHGKLS